MSQAAARRPRGALLRRRKAWLIGAATAAVLVLLTWVLLGSSLLGVRSVRVIGAGTIPVSRVLRAAGISAGIPLLRVDTGAAARRVDRITQVQSARVTRSWPDTILIAVTPRVPVLAVPNHPGYDLMDAYGVVLGWSARRPAGLAVLIAPAGPAAALRGNAAVAAAGTVLRDLPGTLRRTVVAVSAAARGAVTLILRGGATVFWGGPNRAAAKAAELTVLLRTRARHYDISDPQTAVTSR